MGGSSSALRLRSRSASDLDRIRPTSEQRQPKKRGKLSAFAHSSTKRLSKITFKRKGGSRDQMRTFRDLLSAWPASDIEAMYRELETGRVLRLLSEQADAARPPVPSIGDQLMAATNASVRLVFNGTEYPVHARLLSTRCDRFREVGRDSLVDISSSLDSLSQVDMRRFIHFLYTDEWDGDAQTLSRLRAFFDCPRPLLLDLESAAESAARFGDVQLVLTNHTALQREHEPTPSSCSTPSEFSVRVDSDIVGARSPLLGRLIDKLLSSDSGCDRLVLDEALLPRAFLPLIIHFVYTDQLDFGKVVDGCASLSSLSEARAIVAGRSPHSPLHRAIHLVHIARFFGLDRLAHMCEDVIVSSLCVDSCVSVLCWARDGGSPYVERRAVQFTAQHVCKVAAGPHLFDLSPEALCECLESPSLQAAEVEVLEAVIRWGEHELLRRMETREPNVVADTSHSISRRGVRRAELSGAELREILAPLMARVRVDYVLPPFHASLTSAYQRGLLERGPLKDLVVCSSTAEINPDIHWFAPDDNAEGTRFYPPYYEATRSELGSHLSGERVARPPPSGHSTLSRPRSAHTMRPAREGVRVSCAIPQLVDGGMVEEVKQRIYAAIEEEDQKHLIRFFPRSYHRKKAVELIALRVMRWMDVSPDAMQVTGEWDADWSPSGSNASGTLDPSSLERRLASPSPRLTHRSQPHLHWPDIMTTLERNKEQQMSNELEQFVV